MAARQHPAEFAEILAKATRVLGSQDEAEQWLERPAIGLNQERPVDLLTTPAGVNWSRTTSDVLSTMSIRDNASEFRAPFPAHSWNLIFDPLKAAGFYSLDLQEPFALDTRLHPPG